MNRRNLLGTFAAATVVLPSVGLASSPKAAPAQPLDSLRESLRERRIATHDGESLYVQDYGRGRPVLFVHGWTMNTEFWEYQTDPILNAGLRYVAYDQRGCGRSSAAAFGFDIDSLADDLDSVMQTLDLHDAVLVGHSMGCSEIARYLTRHGAQRVSKVVLTSTVTPRVLPDPAMAAPILEKLIHDMRADRPRYLQNLSAPFFHPSKVSPELVQWAILLSLKASLRASIAYTRTNLNADLSGDMKSFTMPTLVIHGGGDGSAPLATSGAPTAAAIPGAKLVVYDDAPHGLPLTHAERLSRDIAAFIGA